MKLGEGVRIALGSLWANPLRSFLTLLGIIIGITAIILVISVINGLDIYVNDKLSNFGPGVFVMNRLGLIHNWEDFVEAFRRNKKLTIADADTIRQNAVLAETVAVETHATDSLTVRGETLRGIDIGGISAGILDIEPYDLDGGHFITDAEVEHAMPVVFIGSDVADVLFPQVDPVGQKLRIGNRSFTVVGLARKRGSVFGESRDNFVKIPITLHQKIYGARNSVNISVKAADPAHMQDAIDEARVILRTRHHLRYEEEDDFGVVSPEGINALWDSLTKIIFRVAVFVVGISLVVGGIVVMNIMLVSVIEGRAIRRRF